MNGKKVLRVLLACALIAAVIPSCRRIPRIALTERDLQLSIEHGGYMRELILHVPKNHEQLNAIPLVIALHGGGGTAKGMIRLTLARFNELADMYGFIAVYPEGLGKSWNDGREDPISYAHKNNIDDIGFLSKIIQQTVKQYHADPNAVFVTGISNGGFMCMRVSRELADQVKAVAPVCATIPVATQDLHSASPAMNVLLINGTDDPLVPYSGGDVQVLGKKRGRVISTDETIELFRLRTGCSDNPHIEEFTDKDPEDGTRAIRYTYTNAETGDKVVLLKMTGAGHTWPGGWQYLAEKVIGKTSRDINACDEIWSFFNSLE
jgi:polyhydroxybutyrate depolymerase